MITNGESGYCEPFLNLFLRVIHKHFWFSVLLHDKETCDRNALYIVVKPVYII